MRKPSVADRTPFTSAALVVLDGLGDRPNPDTGGVSPVEAARTPFLDRLASQGDVGEVSVLGPGVAPESDAGVLALLGYDPVHDSPGRGVLEALGVEVPLGPGDVALRLNFATVDRSGRVVDSRVGRTLTTDEASRLARALTEADLLADAGIRAEVRATVGHRGVLWLRRRAGLGLSPNVSNADPFYEKVGGMGQARRPSEPRVEAVEPLDGSPEAARTAQALNLLLERVVPVLEGHPVNARRVARQEKAATGLLLRNAGTLPERAPEPFEKRYGVHGAALTEMPVERGIARLLGFEDLFVGPMRGDPAAGYGERATATRELLGRFPFVYVHLKGPDEPGHDGDARRKLAVVEEIDRSFFGPFLDGLDLASVRLAVTADHATPAILKAHSDDPVPVLFAGGPGGAARRAVPRKFGASPPSGARPEPLRGVDVLPRLLGRSAHAPDR
jgi:2,3-bisphosphoglycerate-independent phosphoglycerate mutase